MDRIWHIILLWLLTFSAFGQIDSLKRVLSKLPQDTTRVMVLNELAFHYYYINPDTSDYYINKALALAESLDYPRGRALSLMRLGASCSLRGDMVQAMNYLEKGLVIAYELNDFNISGRVLGTFGLTFQQMNDYPKALQYFSRAIENFAKVGNTDMVSTMYMNMGYSNTQLKNYQRADENYITSLTLMRPAHTYYGLLHHNMAIMSLELGQIEKADSLLGIAWTHIGPTSKIQQKGRVQSAYARYYLAKGDIESAYRHCNIALPFFRDNGFKPGLRDTYQLLAEIESQRNNYQKAFEYMGLFMLYKDSIQNELTLQRIQLFEQLDKDRLQTIREKEVGLMAAERRNQQNLLWGALLLFMLVVAGLGYIIINKQMIYSKLKKINADILVKNEELEKNKDDLMALNHKLKNREADLLAINTELNQQQEILFRQRGELERALDSLQLTQEQLLQSEKMASLGVLAAGIAHEINNPLNFIHGGVLYLESYFRDVRPEENEDIKPVLEGMSTGVVRAAAIVKSLSQYSRNDTTLFTDCDIHQIIDGCLVMLNNEYMNRIEIERNYTQSEHVFKGNEGKLHQAFLNILDNAIQAIEGKGKINIKTTIDDGKLKVVIMDSGQGIPPENLTKIFDPFFTTKGMGKGTGLGLSITYKIVQDHQGNILFESQVGVGTCAILYFPLITEKALAYNIMQNNN